MLRTFTLLVALLFTYCVAVSEEIEVNSTTVPTPESIIAGLKSADQPANMQIPFKETRRYRLKKTDMEFSGVMRLVKDRGISIEYTEPTQRIFILDNKGLRIRNLETQSDQFAPEEAGVVVGVFLDLIQLNSDKLNSQFSMRIKEQADAPQWSLELKPKSAELSRFFQYIDLEGENDQLNTIFIQNGRSRWKEIKFLTAPKPFEATETNLNTYF